MPYLLGIDIGTSGTKAALFDPRGAVVAAHTVSYPMYHPQNGWAEQDAADWWAAAASAVRQVVGHSGVRPGDIAAVGLTGQMHSLTLLDRDGEVIRPAILWCDQRTGAECGELTARVGAERLIEITANPAMTGFTASKLLWVRNHEPEAYARARLALLPKDYIRYKLTGAAASDVSDASGVQLLDIGKRAWSLEALKALDIEPSLLPRVYESPEVTGRITKQAAALTGLPEGTPVVAGAGDNAAAAVGTGVVREGVSFTTIGTSGVVFVHTDTMKIDPRGRVHTLCCAVPGAWHMMGVTLAAGFSLHWFKDEFCQAEREAARLLGDSPYKILDEAAARAPLGADRLLYLPYLQGERTPHRDPDCRGAFIGLSASHTRRELLRAVMEGVCYSLRDCAGIFAELGAPLSHTRACGGGATSAVWRQMLADVMGLPILTPKSKEGPALGAALLAGVGAGLYKSVPEACDAVIDFEEERQQPDADAHAAYDKLYAAYTAAYPALKGLFQQLAGV
jgi:xylulokinase